MNLSGLTPDERADFEERAAIKEFHGGMPRSEAETQAIGEILDKKLLKAKRERVPNASTRI